MRYLKLVFWVPVALVVLASMYVAWLCGRATSHSWLWLTLLLACVAGCSVPILYWPSVAGALTVVAVKVSR